VRLSRQGAEVVLPEGVSLEQARQLMLDAQQYDGVLEIGSNGDIVVTDEAYENFKQTLGVDCRAITIEDAFDQYRAAEQLSEFAAGTASRCRTENAPQGLKSWTAMKRITLSTFPRRMSWAGSLCATR
jgi:hypothetical protein